MKVGLEGKKKESPAVPLTAAAQQAAAAANKQGAAKAPAVAAPAPAAAAQAPVAPADKAAPEDKAAAKARAKQEKVEAKALAKAGKAAKKKSDKVDRRKPASGGIKELLLRHVEKLVVGAGVIGMLLLIWAAVGRIELLPNHSPDDLRAQVVGIQDRVRTAVFPVRLFPVPNYEESLRRREGRAAADPFAYTSQFDPVLVPKTKRGEPELYAPEDPVALAGAGAIYVKRAVEKIAPLRHLPAAGAAAAAPHPTKAAGTTLPMPKDFNLEGVDLPPDDPKHPRSISTEGRRWVAINAKLPMVRQQGEYDHEFANAFDHNPSRDRPLYLEVLMRRQEILPGEQADQLDWSHNVKEWSLREMMQLNNREQQTWAMTSPEVVPSELLHDDSYRLPEAWRRLRGIGVMAKPLAPLVNESWKPWANHPALQAMLTVENQPEAAAPEASEEETPEPGHDANQAKGPDAPKAPGPKATPAAPGAAKAMGLDAPKAAGGGADKGLGPMDQIDQLLEENRAAAETAPKPKKSQRLPRKSRIAPGQRLGDFQLVRVFDFTVEPGKRYRYELKLMLRNPNFDPQIQPRNLKHPEAREGNDKIFRYTDWSKPTNIVSIPSGDATLADAIVEPTEDLPERTARIVVHVLDFKNGEESGAKMTLRRGGLASGQVTLYTLHAIDRTVTKQDDKYLHTDLMLGDLHGGEKIVTGLVEPAEMLFVDSAGRLVVQDSVEDEDGVSAFLRWIHIFDVPPPVATGPSKGAGRDNNPIFNTPAGQPKNKKTTPPKTNTHHKSRSN